jgi:hypothetical protein
MNTLLIKNDTVIGFFTDYPDSLAGKTEILISNIISVEDRTKKYQKPC